MINLEVPKKFTGLVDSAHQVAENVFRANTRKYDLAEHEYPKELDMLAALIDGMNDSGALGGAGAGTVGDGSSNGSAKKADANATRNGSNMAIELEGLRLATLRAAARVDQGLPFHREVALARRLCAERGMQIGSDGVQLLGGHGYTKEHPVERWYRDLRAAGLMEGALVL